MVGVVSDPAAIAFVAIAALLVAHNVHLHRGIGKRGRLIDRLHAANRDLALDVEVLRDAVTTAREVFDAYGDYHERKDTAEGRDKAARNRRLANVMAIGLQITKPEEVE
jgi:hypothetical protein